MRKISLLIILAFLFIAFNMAVASKERLLADGADMLLRIAPVDPRAPLLGDYMDLDYSINRDIYQALQDPNMLHLYIDRVPLSGLAVIRIAEEAVEGVPKGAAVLARLDDGRALGPGEAHLFFRMRRNEIITAASAYYFHEGTAQTYANAVYARLRLDDDGTTMLVALCDENGNDLRP